MTPFDIRPSGSRPWRWRYYGVAVVTHTDEGVDLAPVGRVHKGRVGLRRWIKSLKEDQT